MTRDVQLRNADSRAAGGADIDVDAEHDPEVSRRASNAGLRREVQKKAGSGTANEQQVHAAAQQGIAGPGQPLPFRDQIQASFGQHDISHVRAHIAPGATAAMGAQAYATGDHVVFNGQPDLHTAAHEVAHVVQQKKGVQLKGGVGAEGDTHERHADAVADHVVAGKSAEHMLGPAAAGGGASSQAVQMKPAAKAEDPTAAHGKSDQMSMGSAQSALQHLAKELHGWRPKLEAAMSIDTKGPAGIGPAQNAVSVIFEAAKNDASRVSDLVLTAKQDERKYLAPDVKKVQGAFARFWIDATKAQNWVKSNGGDTIQVLEIEVIINGLTQQIGLEDKLEPDIAPPDGDEKSLSKTMIKDQLDALEAAVTSVKSGNEKDAGRIVMHLRYLDGISGEHAAEIKAQKKTLNSLLKQVDELRQDHPALADKISEAHFHLAKLVK
jgi:hypothetical protein